MSKIICKDHRYFSVFSSDSSWKYSLQLIYILILLFTLIIPYSVGVDLGEVLKGNITDVLDTLKQKPISFLLNVAFPSP